MPFVFTHLPILYVIHYRLVTW